MLTNNFIGDEHNNIVILSGEYNKTTLQCLHKSYQDYGSYHEVATVELEPDDLWNLITGLVMRYNDLPDYARENCKAVLTKQLQSLDPKDDPKSEDYIPF